MTQRWQKNVIGPAFTLKEIHSISWLVFCAGLTLLAIMWIKWERQGDKLEGLLGPDHATFYIMGRILNEHAPDRIYDVQLQERLYGELRPHESWGYANPYPPFLALLFRPIAKLGFLNAYFLWSSISLALYLLGLWILFRRFGPHDLLQRSLIVCFSLSFYPFVLETLYNGQLSAIAFFAFAMALHEDDAHRPITSGAALSLCLYKPTLIVVVLPFLFITRRFKTLLGLGLGAGGLFLGTSAFLGLAIWQGFFKMLLFYAQHATGGQKFFRTWKYLDLNAFWRLLLGRNWMSFVLLALCLALAAWVLFRIWRNATSNEREAGMLSWAITITSTLLLNVYVPIYDSLLIIPSLILTASIIEKWQSVQLQRAFTLIWTLFLVVPWFTQTVAEHHGLQLMTLLIVALGTLQLVCLQRVIRHATEDAGARIPRLSDVSNAG